MPRKFSRETLKRRREGDCDVAPPAVLLILGCHANKSAFELSRIQRKREMRRVEGALQHAPHCPSSLCL